MSGSRPRPAELRAAGHEAALARRSPCVAEERLVAFHAGGLTPAEQDGIRDHLAVCAACGEASRDARRFLEAMGERSRAEAARRWRRPLVLAATVTLAIASAWLASRPRPAGRTIAVAPTASPVRTADGWSDLRIAKPPYLPAGRVEDELVFRGDEAGAGRDDFARAMAAYGRDDLAAAHRGLAAHVARHPEDRQAWFYRGATELLLGRTKEGHPHVEQGSAG